MKRNRVLYLILGIVMCVPFAIGLAGCRKDTSQIKVAAKDVYALSAISSVSYLQNNAPSVLQMQLLAETRPSTVTDEDVAGVKNCLGMFDEILQNNGFKQTTSKNTDTSEDLSKYTFVMEIELPNLTSKQTYKLYYNETETETEREIEDEQEEVEVSTKLEGIVVADTEQYIVNGERNFEIEGDESESSIEFTTYLDQDNYIVVEQSVENDEIEYEYKIYENGKKVQDVEIELEKENDKTELEFQIKDLSTNVTSKTVYKLEKYNDNSFIAKIKKGDNIETFVIEIVGDGYKLIYDNGFTEIV